MKRRTSRQIFTALGVGALLASSFAAGGCRGQKSGDPPIHPNWNMDDQQYFEAQEDNAWFPDNRAMRMPVAGTIARGQLKGTDDTFRGRGPDGRLIDALPAGMALDEALLARGEARYAIYCAVCHEKSGYGQGVIVQKGFAVPPPSYHEPRLRAMPLGHFYDVITRGKGTMLSYAAQIPVEDRWAIAAWVRVLQVSQQAKIADVPTDVLKKLQSEGGAE